MKPSSDIDLFTTTLPFPVLVSLNLFLRRTLACSRRRHWQQRGRRVAEEKDASLEGWLHPPRRRPLCTRYSLPDEAEAFGDVGVAVGTLALLQWKGPIRQHLADDGTPDRIRVQGHDGHPDDLGR